MILVTGATGTVGGALVRRLAADGHTTRAMTRRPDALRAELAGVGRVGMSPVEVVAGDADDPAGLDLVFAGVDAAFLMSAQAVGSAPAPTHDLALAAAAARAGVPRLVKLSVFSGGDGVHGVDALARWHAEAEQAVSDAAGEWTLLRPGRFHSNALAWAPMLRRGDTVAVPFADRPAVGVDPDDVAAVAAVALETDRLVGEAPRLTGPALLTPLEEVRILGTVLGRDLRVEPVDDETVRVGMLAHSGMSTEAVDAALARTRRPSAVTGELEGVEVLPTVPAILGRRARSFADWAQDHRASFSR